MLKTTTLIAALAIAWLPSLTAAQPVPPRDELKREVENAIARLLPNGAGDVVGRISQVKPEGGISRNFDLAKVQQAVFGRNVPSTAPDCRSEKTPAGEPDEEQCVLDSGRADDPTGAYRMLSFSKNIGLGDIRYYNRPAFNPQGSADPAPVKLSDQAAYDAALAFLDLVGVPASEIPRPPAGTQAPLPVRSLVVGSDSEKGGEAKRAAIQKVVSLPRAFLVPGGLYKDPVTGRELNHVIAPGRALVAVDDAGVQFAEVDGWVDAQMDPNMDPRHAKSNSELAAEIAEDLYNEGVRKVGSLSILIGLRNAYPHPDDPNPPICPVCGLMRAALFVQVSQAGPGRVETSQQSFAAPGLMREYDLVHTFDFQRPAR